MEGDNKIRLNIPLQDMAAFTLFPPNAAAAHSWSQALPAANTETVVTQISQAISDLNRVKLNPETRYNIIEALRPVLDVALANLSKRILNQPLIMPDEPQKIADLRDRLYTLASTAYTIVAVEAIQQRDTIRDTNPARLTCQSIQRALMYAGGKVLQTFQLFRPLKIHGWHAMHQLYALAESQQLVDLRVPEPLDGGKTIKATYLQALLLGCCKPNHLRQTDLAALYKGLQDWADLVTLETAPSENGLFVVDLGSDQPPLYSTVYKKQSGVQCRYIDTSGLIAELQALASESGHRGIRFDKNFHLPGSTLEHLIGSLGTISTRNFARTMADNELLICIGLRSTHFHAAGQTGFEQVLYGADYIPEVDVRAPRNPFLASQIAGDVWQRANPKEDHINDGPNPNVEDPVDLDELTKAKFLQEDSAPRTHTEDYPVFKVQLADASPGGYCLEWNSDLPGDIRSGDILGLKEENNKDWVIAAIRWMSQRDNHKTLIGLELLSPIAMSFGASIHQKSGERTPPIRVLLLPEIKLVGQPQTLITPRAGFKQKQKVTISNSTEQQSIQLQRQITSTGSFAQFEFRYIKELGDILAEDKTVKLGADSDSLWSNI